VKDGKTSVQPKQKAKNMKPKAKADAKETIKVPAVLSESVAIQTKAEAAQSDKVRELGKAIIQSLGQVGEKYHALITYIRHNSVAPKLVTTEMAALGFNRTRISEVKRVAYAADDTFKAYEAKLIGFGNALQMARASDEKGGAAKLTPAGLLLTEGGVINHDEADAAIEDAEAAGGDKKKTKKKSSSVRIKAMATELGTWLAVNAKDKLPYELLLPFAHVPGGFVKVRVFASTGDGTEQ